MTWENFTISFIKEQLKNIYIENTCLQVYIKFPPSLPLCVCHAAQRHMENLEEIGKCSNRDLNGEWMHKYDLVSIYTYKNFNFLYSMESMDSQMLITNASISRKIFLI